MAAEGHHRSGWLSLRRVVFHDARYPRSMVRDPAKLAGELAHSHGLHLVDAPELAAWMEAWVGHGAEDTLCVLTHGAAPDSIAQSPSRSCLARRYMEAGGRLAWLGDTPFYYQASPGRLTLWGSKALEAVLDLRPSSESPCELPPTEEGRKWGLSRPDEPACCVPSRDVSVVLTGTAGGMAGCFLKNFSPDFPMGGFLRLMAPPAEDAAAVAELARAAGHGLAARPEEDEVSAPEAYPDPGGALVESGSFKVDRDSALEKLQRYQLRDAAMYLLPWVRCAVAGEATRIAFSRSADGLRMRFGGRPLEAEKLKDPYRHLFEGGPDVARYRHLATGLLTAFRLEPRRITVASGKGETRFLLTLDSPRRERLEPVSASDEDTIITVSWDALSWKRPKVHAHVDYVRSHCDASRCAFEIERGLAGGLWGAGDALDSVDGPEPGFGLRFEDEGVSGWVEIPREPIPVSKLDAYSWGVRIGPLQMRLPLAQVRGRVSDDAFGLNASQSAVANDGRLSHASVVLARQAERLLLETVEGLTEHFAAVGRLLAADPGLRGDWIACVDMDREDVPEGEPFFVFRRWGRGLSRLASRLSRGERQAAVARCARLAVWLREAARGSLWDKDDDAGSPALKALWDAPLYFDARGRPLSLRSIVQAKERNLGLIRYATRASWTQDAEAIWKIADGDLAMLSSQFGDALTDCTSELD